MAYTAGSLHLRAGAPGDLSYTYDAGSDTMATVLASGYFNNGDDNLNLVADDLVWCQCTDGNLWMRVKAVDSGSVVTCEYAGGDLPIQTFATGTAAALNLLKVGYYEVGTSIATATRNVLPTPYAGAAVMVRRVDSGTQLLTFEAGACASGISLGASDSALAGGTGVTYDSVGNRLIQLTYEGDGFHVVGTSSTRWRLYNLEFTSSAINEAASAVLSGT